ncbi:MAG TPA: lyase family protein [Steroidobacteraceae bacterium]|jgi:3-carboxy-cis,cis-muconate cycloisomerase
MSGSLLRTRPATTTDMLAVFDDASTLRHALAFESALAQAQAEAGLIDAQSAQAIAAACGAFTVDIPAFAESVALAGTLAIPLLQALRAQLTDAPARDLHRGATSQDLADTVLMLQMKQAGALLGADHARLVTALTLSARQFAALPAVGRTLLQDARPIGFGLRIAQWAAGIRDAARDIERTIALHANVQLGGAAGTRADMQGRGTAVAARLAERLQLNPSPPWHARRGGIAAMAASLAIGIGALGKMARDISLLAQSRLGEVLEPLVEGRGGSSAMPHKRNPTGCQVALAAATRAPGLVAGVLAGLPCELERGLGGWQAEGPVLAELCLLAAGSARAMADVAQGLVVMDAAIARNLAESAVGGDIAESVQIVADLLDPPRGEH